MTALELARKHRPATFGDVAGQKPVVAVLALMCKNGTVPPALLFTGESGCGKTTLARILAAALNCEEPISSLASWPCGRCAPCKAVARGLYVHVEEVDAASNGSVEKIRDIRQRVNYGTGGEYHVVILDEAHSMSEAAFNALLGVLEHPPERVVFILCTTRPDKILKTVYNRCSPFEFRPLTTDLITDRLAHICQAEGFEPEPGLLEAIAASARGGMRLAITKLEQLAGAGIFSTDLWRELTGETDFAPGLISAAADGDHPAMFAGLDRALAAYGDAGHVTDEVILCLCDLIVLSQGGEVAAQGAELAARRDLSARLGPARVQAAMGVLWDLKAKVHVGGRPGLSLALSMVSRRLCNSPLDASPIAASGSRPASLAAFTAAVGGRSDT
jgi:DNA polymerase III subunit gamma/tau